MRAEAREVLEVRLRQRGGVADRLLRRDRAVRLDRQRETVVVRALPDARLGDGARLGSLLRTPIDDLELSVRSVNSLKNSNIRTLGDLVRQTESQILQVKNFGKKSLQEIADLLEREGLNFGMRFEDTGDGVRITDWGTPPSQAAANAPDEEEE
jgi:DNA-directed RNA polymerase subunit alpha